MMSVVALTLWLAAAPSAPSLAAPAASAPPASALPPAAAPLVESKPSVDVSADRPPPSAYDRLRAGGEAVPEEGASLAGQLVRTVLSLLFVVALIYVGAKIGLARLGRVRGAGGPSLRVLERLQLDGRNAVYIIELFGKQRLLVGGSDKGLTLLARLDDEGKESGQRFKDALAVAGEKSEAGGNDGSEDRG